LFDIVEENLQDDIDGMVIDEDQELRQAKIMELSISKERKQEIIDMLEEKERISNRVVKRKREEAEVHRRSTKLRLKGKLKDKGAPCRGILEKHLQEI